MRRHPFLVLPLLLISACSLFSRTPVPNPDPNHTHADFAVWVGGTQLDFSDPRYMSEEPTDDAMQVIPSAFAHNGVDDEAEHIAGREYIHLHDGSGHVIHVHKPGMTIGNFFTSIGLNMTFTCLALDDYQFGLLDPSWRSDFAVTKNVCDTGKFHWTMVVNGNQMAMDPGYVIVDTDKILLTYGTGDDWQGEWQQMTDDACRYSKTCPWRGEPPTENCIADPQVPCVGV